MDVSAQVSAHACIADDVRLGARVRVSPFVNLYGCEVGDDSRLGAFVEIQRGARIGSRCKVSSHSFICEGVTIEDEVFVGHGVVFINDRTPRATNADGRIQSENDWQLVETVVRRRASLGSGAIIMCGVEIGEGAMVGAGALVTHDVPPHAVVAGVPARLRRLVAPSVTTARDGRERRDKGV
jgi:acetyltransferase-like isoleucine patch superfamily enzyme